LANEAGLLKHQQPVKHEPVIEINKEFTDFFNDSDQTASPFRFRRYRLGARWNPGRLPGKAGPVVPRVFGAIFEITL